MEKKKRWSLILFACFLTVYTVQQACAWETTSIDNGPVLGPSSLVVDGSDYVHIVYCDKASHTLKYASNVTGAWVSTFIDPPLEASYPSVAVDSAGHLHVVCSSVESMIKYISNAAGSWTVTDIGYGGNPSIAVDPSGHVHLCYMGGPEVWYATNGSGAWVKEKVSTIFFYSSQTSIAADSSGHAHLLYAGYMDFYYLDGYENYATNASGYWVETSLPFCPLTQKAWNPSIAIDPSDHVNICYMSAFFLGDYHSIYLTHASNERGGFISGIAAWEAMKYLPVSTAMVTDSKNSAHISYTYMEEDYTFRLKYATNTQGSWGVSVPLSEQIDSTGPSIGVDSSGKVYISYTDTGSRLLATSGKAEGLTTTWPGTPAEASGYGEASRQGSSLFNNLVTFLIAAGTIICLRICRQKSR